MPKGRRREEEDGCSSKPKQAKIICKSKAKSSYSGQSSTEEHPSNKDSEQGYELETVETTPCIPNVDDPSVSAMTTHQLQQDKSTLFAALEMLNGLASKKHTTTEIRERLRLEGEDQRVQREVSPDIIHGPYMSRKKSKEAKNKKRVGTEPDKEAEALTEQSSSEAKLRELVNRKRPKNTNFQQQLEDANYDLSKLKYGVKGTLEFQEKSKAYKAHCDVITSMKPKVLAKNFKKISAQLEDIAGQTIDCERHTLFKTGKKGELKLQNVSVPFNAMQGSTLFSMLYDFLVSEMEERPLWTEYINYVMLPEAFIRIYARANKISYELATQEMRFGEYYDGCVPH